MKPISQERPGRLFLRSGPCMDPIILQWYVVFWHQPSLTCGRRQSHNAPFCLACQVHASSFYVIPYGFQMLRIFPKKLDEPCDLVNSDWLNVVLNSFRILMCRCFLHSDHREELRDYPMPRDYGSGHLLSLFGKLHSSVRLMDQVSLVGKVPYHAGHGRRFDVQHIGKVDRARVSLIVAISFSTLGPRLWFPWPTWIRAIMVPIWPQVRASSSGSSGLSGLPRRWRCYYSIFLGSLESLRATLYPKW